jgi:hypothetical protein
MVKKCVRCKNLKGTESCNLCGDFCCFKCIESRKEAKHCKGIVFCKECLNDLQPTFKICPSHCNHLFYPDLSSEIFCQCCDSKIQSKLEEDVKLNECDLEFEQRDSIFSVSGKTFIIKEFLKELGFRWNPDLKIWTCTKPGTDALKEKILQAYLQAK